MISFITSILTPLIMALVGVWALSKHINIFDALTEGATSGLKIMLKIFPAMVVLISSISMLRASGALEIATDLLRPILEHIGIPSETVPLMLLRPISGSGALAVGSDLINSFGADSIIGRTAAVMLGSTETTFYVIAVYLGSVGAKYSRRTVLAAICADLAGFISAALIVNKIWG